MAKQTNSSEREMRDRMNNIIRNANGEMISIHGKPITREDRQWNEALNKWATLEESLEQCEQRYQDKLQSHT